MDRVTVYPGQIPLETDLLSTNKNALVALGFLAQDILGTSTLASGLACAPTSPASLNVNIAPGRIYSLQNLDALAYSSLPADTVHALVKQGISLDTAQLACPAPATSGYAVNYLIEAAFSEADTDAVALPYYNSANPAQPYSGPDNSGAAQHTARKGAVVLTAKPGVAAPTGSQTTPAADSGNVGLWVVTVAYGQTTITSGNIAQVSGAPFIANTLTQLAPLVSPAFSGAPTAPTPATSDASTKLATTAFVQAVATALGTSYALAADVVAGASTALAVTPAALASGFSAAVHAYTAQQYSAPVSRTGQSGSQAVDLDTHQLLAITATAAIALAAPANLAVGKTATIMVYSALSVALGYDAAYLASAGYTLPTATTAGKWLILSFLCHKAGSLLLTGVAEEA